MYISIYYALDGGTTKFLSAEVKPDTTLFHIDDPDTFRRTCVDIVAAHTSYSGKVTIIHAAT